jgi:hypothetical protein
MAKAAKATNSPTPSAKNIRSAMKGLPLSWAEQTTRLRKGSIQETGAAHKGAIKTGLPAHRNRQRESGGDIRTTV